MSEVRLQVTDAHGRRVVRLDTPRFTIGRRSASDLQVVSTDVSREHAEITRLDGQFVVHDRGSRYGTYVNGAPVTERALVHGDRIRLGRTDASSWCSSPTPMIRRCSCERNASEEEFGRDRLIACVESSHGLDPETLVERLLQDVRDFTVGEPQTDDLTALVLRYRGLK